MLQSLRTIADEHAFEGGLDTLERGIAGNSLNHVKPYPVMYSRQSAHMVFGLKWTPIIQNFQCVYLHTGFRITSLLKQPINTHLGAGWLSLLLCAQGPA